MVWCNSATSQSINMSQSIDMILAARNGMPLFLSFILPSTLFRYYYGLILAVFITVVEVSFFDRSVIQLKSKLTVTRVSILETWDSIWIESRVSRLLLSGTVLCKQEAFSPFQLLHQEIVLCQSCIDLLWISGSNLLCWSCSSWSAIRNFLS